MAILVSDKKLDHFYHEKSLPIAQNNLAYHPGLVSPPGGDGSPLQTLIYRLILEITLNIKFSCKVKGVLLAFLPVQKSPKRLYQQATIIS